MGKDYLCKECNDRHLGCHGKLGNTSADELTSKYDWQ